MMAVDIGIARIYDGGMRKITDAELSPRTIPLINACPKCGGTLKALVLIGLGVFKPQKKICMNQCGFDVDIRPKADRG